MPLHTSVRKTLTGLVGLALLGGLMVTSAPARADGAQRVEGEVTLPAPPTCGIHAFVDAVLLTATGEGPFFSFDFEVDPDTWGGTFDLTPDGTTSDLDITFWGLSLFETRSFGGESGSVPAGATKASVCLMVGVPTTFQYIARSGSTTQVSTDQQVVHGEVLVASGPHSVGPVAAAACGTLGATTGFLTGQDVFGFSFEVDPKTRDSAFTLAPELPAALGVTFSAPLLSKHFESPPAPAPGSEGELRGTVPTWAQEATVCLVVGPPTAFTYRAG